MALIPKINPRHGLMASIAIVWVLTASWATVFVISLIQDFSDWISGAEFFIAVETSILMYLIVASVLLTRRNQWGVLLWNIVVYLLAIMMLMGSVTFASHAKWVDLFLVILIFLACLGFNHCLYLADKAIDAERKSLGFDVIVKPREIEPEKQTREQEL